MNLRWLQAYRAVVLTGSVTEAAAQLNITQPAVSRMLTSLQDYIGLTLFNRQRGKLVATAEGELFFREAERILEGVADLLETARTIRSGGSETLRIVSMASFSAGLLPDAISWFREAQPGTRIVLETRDRRSVERWVATQQFDLGIANLPIDTASLKATEFCPTEAYLVMPKGHRLASRNRVSFADLIGERMIALSRSSWIRTHMDEAFQRHGASPDICIEVPTMSTAAVLVARGLGVAVADPASLAAVPDLAVNILPFDPPIQFRYGFLFPINRPVPARVRQFTDMVEAAAVEMLSGIEARLAAQSGT